MQYPIIHMFDGDKNIYAKNRAPEYASVSLFKTFENSIVLDSLGKKYLMKDVGKVGWAYLLGYHPLMKGRTAKVEFNFSSMEQLTLDNYKQTVIDKLSNGVHKGFWYSAREVPRLVVKVNNCVDYKSVVQCFV